MVVADYFYISLLVIFYASMKVVGRKRVRIGKDND